MGEGSGPSAALLPDWFDVDVALAGRQSVLTPQLVHLVRLKLIVPAILLPLTLPEAVPLSWPVEVSMVTPLKSIQPVFCPQALPDNIPWPLLVTPQSVQLVG